MSRLSMAESYTEALRDKRELEKKISRFRKEQKTQFALIAVTKQEIQGSLLDLQSKTRGLNDSLSFIATQLIDEKKKAEEELQKMQVAKAQNRYTNGLQMTEEKLSELVLHHKEKISWLSDFEQKKAVAEVKKAIDVVNILGGSNGFKGILTKLRAGKKDEPRSRSVEQEESAEPPIPKEPQDVAQLIMHFQKLPKIYPSKPKKKKPKRTEVMLQQYAERKKQREQLMKYATRRRIRRADFHYDAIRYMFLQVNNSNGSALEHGVL